MSSLVCVLVNVHVLWIELRVQLCNECVIVCYYVLLCVMFLFVDRSFHRNPE